MQLLLYVTSNKLQNLIHILVVVHIKKIGTETKRTTVALNSFSRTECERREISLLRMRNCSKKCI